MLRVRFARVQPLAPSPHVFFFIFLNESAASVGCAGRQHPGHEALSQLCVIPFLSFSVWFVRVLVRLIGRASALITLGTSLAGDKGRVVMNPVDGALVDSTRGRCVFDSSRSTVVILLHERTQVTHGFYVCGRR